MATQLRWYTYLDTNAGFFRIYRAITGISANFPNSLRHGDQLVFAATSPTVQTVTLTGGDINTVIADINRQGKGVYATKNAAGTKLFIRCTATREPRFKLLRCSFATKTGQVIRTVGPRSEYLFLSEVEHVSGQYDYTLQDQDGQDNDWYYLTTVKNNLESLPSLALKPIRSVGETCSIVGRIMTLRNEPIPGAEISASMMGPASSNPADESLVSEEKITCLSDEEGRWSVAVTKGQLVLLEIPTIGYNEVIRVPDLAYVLFKDLVPLNDHYFNPTGEQSP